MSLAHKSPFERQLIVIPPEVAVAHPDVPWRWRGPAAHAMTVATLMMGGTSIKDGCPHAEYNTGKCPECAGVCSLHDWQKACYQEWEHDGVVAGKRSASALATATLKRLGVTSERRNVLEEEAQRDINVAVIGLLAERDTLREAVLREKVATLEAQNAALSTIQEPPPVVDGPLTRELRQAQLELKLARRVLTECCAWGAEGLVDDSMSLHMFAHKVITALKAKKDTREVRPGYEPLAAILDAALAQAQHGKGKERHDYGQTWERQSINAIPEMQGTPAGLVYQVCKKAVEASHMPDPVAAYREALGCVVYSAALAFQYSKAAGKTKVENASKYGLGTAMAGTAFDEIVKGWRPFSDRQKADLNSLLDTVQAVASPRIAKGALVVWRDMVYEVTAVGRDPDFCEVHLVNGKSGDLGVDFGGVPLLEVRPYAGR